MKYNALDILLAIIEKAASITTAGAVAARVDACELILKGGNLLSAATHEQREAAETKATNYLIRVATGDNGNADLTTRMCALKSLITANVLEGEIPADA